MWLAFFIILSSLVILQLIRDLFAPIASHCTCPHAVTTRLSARSRATWFASDDCEVRLTTAPNFRVGVGDQLSIVQRQTRSGSLVGPVLAVVNNSSRHAHVRSRWNLVIFDLAMSAVLILITLLMTVALPYSWATISRMWPSVIIIWISSLLSLKSRLTLAAMVSDPSPDPTA